MPSAAVSPEASGAACSTTTSRQVPRSKAIIPLDVRCLAGSPERAPEFASSKRLLDPSAATPAGTVRAVRSRSAHHRARSRHRDMAPPPTQGRCFRNGVRCFLRPPPSDEHNRRSRVRIADDHTPQGKIGPLGSKGPAQQLRAKNDPWPDCRVSSNRCNRP
jgi:hypothetical protein